jgi:hypothetical protein
LAQACADRIDLVLQLSKRKNRKLRSDDGRSVGTNIGMALQDLADGAALGQVDELFRGRGRTPFGKPLRCGLFNVRFVTGKSGTKIAHAYFPLTIRAVSTLQFLTVFEQGNL